jgi:hypothetical protein
MKRIFAALLAVGMLAGCAASKLAQESEHHSASELDVRAADHCDCNRALPGSVQAAVHVPDVGQWAPPKR